MRTVAFWLSLILIFMIPLENSLTVGGFGTVTKLVGLSVAGFWTVTVVTTGKVRTLRPFHLVVFLFILWNTISFFWTYDTERTLSRIITYFQLVGLIWLLWDIYTTSAILKTGLQVYVLGAYVAIGSLVANYLAGSSFGNEGRFTAEGFNANDLALTLVLGIPVAWYLAISGGGNKKTSILKLLNYAYPLVAVFAVLLTASRSNLVTTSLAFIFIIGTYNRIGATQKFLVLAALISALFVLHPLIPQTSFDRLATINDSVATADLDGRVEIWREGLVVFAEHPLLGVGSSAFRSVTRSGKAPHSTYLSILVDVGIIGFILFAIILIIVIYQAIHQPKLEASFWLILLLVWAVGVSVNNWEYRKHTWLFLSLVIVSANLLTQHVESKQDSEFSPTETASMSPVSPPSVQLTRTRASYGFTPSRERPYGKG